MAAVFLILGIACVLYFAVIVASAGIQVSFGGIWLVVGALCIFTFFVMRRAVLHAWFLQIPKGIRMGAGLILLAGLLLFLTAEGCIISGMTAGAPAELDTVIVLGAQVKGTRVSRALAQRLNRAAIYLQENPGTWVIVSGGRGPGEDITEAEAMAAYLEKKGIAPERILREDRSVNTVQNIQYSTELLGESDRTGLISNNFHIFRAVHIAKAQGLTVEGIPAYADWWMLPHYMVREGFALVKDVLRGNAKL